MIEPIETKEQKQTTEEKMNKISVPPEMKLWDAVCRTDPEDTSEIEGSDLTDINHISQKKRATQLWGRYGGLWGLKNLVWTTLNDDIGPFCERLTCVFYYPGPEGDQILEFEMSDDMIFRIEGAYLPYVRKGLMTSILGKSLSYLGFNADVYSGDFGKNGGHAAGLDSKGLVSMDEQTFDKYLAEAKKGKVTNWFFMLKSYRIKETQETDLKEAYVEWAKSVTKK